METALHQLVARVEKALDQQEFALGVSLNIDGAFDNTSSDPMCSTLTRHGVDQTFVQWIRAILEGWLATVAFGAVSRNVAVFRSCHQGGFITPLMVPCSK